MVFKNFLLILFLITSGYSARLPVKYPKITSNFGESRYDHFHNGIDFGGGEQDVFPVMNGEIIFYFDKSEFPFDNYSGAGNFVVLLHNNKFRSYYLHLKDNSIIKEKFYLTETDIIAKTSDTGRSLGIHLHFSLEKLNPDEFINPFIFFSQTLMTGYLTDRIKPTIENVFIKEGQKIIKLKNRNLLSIKERADILINCYDRMDSSNYKLGVYKIELYLNNEKIREIKFDKLIYKDGAYYLNGKLPFKNFYNENGYIIFSEIEFKEGDNELDISVYDFSGNWTKKEYIIKNE